MSYVGPVYLVIFSCWGVPVPYLKLFWVRRSWVGPVYLVIFSCWGGPIPYLELFWVGPVKKNHPVNQFKPGDRLQKLSLFRLWIRLHLLAVSSVTSEINCNGQRSSTHCELQRQKNIWCMSYCRSESINFPCGSAQGQQPDSIEPYKINASWHWNHLKASHHLKTFHKATQGHIRAHRARPQIGPTLLSITKSAYQIIGQNKYANPRWGVGVGD